MDQRKEEKDSASVRRYHLQYVGKDREKMEGAGACVCVCVMVVVVSGFGSLPASGRICLVCDPCSFQ